MKRWELALLFNVPAIICMGCEKAPGAMMSNMEAKNQPRSGIHVDSASGLVIRQDGPEKVVWSTALQGDLHSDWPPASDAVRVYVRSGNGVTSLDRNSGKLIWYSEGIHDRLMVSGDLLLAADSRDASDIGAGGRWLVARRTGTGEIVFRVALPLDDRAPRPIREIGGLFLVQKAEEPGGEGDAILVDRKGKVRCHFDHQVVDGMRRENDYFFLTSRNVSRLTAQDEVVWSVSYPYPQVLADGGLLRLANGDLIGFLYCTISDTGVQLLRLDPTTGKVVWQARCEGLGVTHSEYKHRANVVVEGNKVRVTSKGAAGTFVEILDSASGKLLERNLSLR
jgi:outer membrane protein assembly factor BamB